jgi:hypothetical protein
MNLPALQNVGLTDWPAWYRKMNPGYFVDETSCQQIAKLQGGRGGGNGVEGILRDPMNVGGMGKEEIAGRVLRSDELREQIVARLGSMSKELKEVNIFTTKAMIEMAAAGHTRGWEDESETLDAEEKDEAGEEEVCKKKLLDV